MSSVIGGLVGGITWMLLDADASGIRFIISSANSLLFAFFAICFEHEKWKNNLQVIAHELRDIGLKEINMLQLKL
jgi:hypothetical protein